MNLYRRNKKLRKAAGLAVASLFFAAFSPLFQACDTKQYENCPESRIIGSWGVTRETHAFGEYDSLYYIINPIGNVKDSLYFNGNYADSYYHSDSTRVMLRYTTEDSIVFHFDRMYSVQVNPPVMIVSVKAERDTSNLDCTLKLKKDDNSDKIYRCGPDSTFRKLLEGGGILKFTATNGPSTAESVGSQNYDFILRADGFLEALHLADSLNAPLKKPVTLKPDSLKKDSTRRELPDEKKKAVERIPPHHERHHEKRR